MFVSSIKKDLNTKLSKADGAPISAEDITSRGSDKLYNMAMWYVLIQWYHCNL